MTDSPAPATKRRPYMRPRDAATLILCDRTPSGLHVLMGKRHEGHKFMPGKFVFPGGAVEPDDRRMPIAGPIDEVVEQKLLARTQRTSSDYARGLALAAIRETFEETGLAVGASDVGAPEAPPNEAWARFAATGVFPALDGLDLIARAITPPDRPKRFDARFFAADASLIAHETKGVVGPEAELVELVWTKLEKALELDLANVTRAVLGDLAALGAGPVDRFRPRPFYHMQHGKRLREML